MLGPAGTGPGTISALRSRQEKKLPFPYGVGPCEDIVGELFAG